MKRFKKRKIVKLVTMVLVFMLLYGNPGFPLPGHSEPLEPQDDQLQSLFQWSVSDYLNGNYREVTRNLHQLLSYFDEEENPGESENSKIKVLKGKIYLLLGATYEQLGDRERGKEYYRLALENFGSREAVPGIEGIDFSSLPGYRFFFTDNKTSLPVKPGVIEKPLIKRKKRGLSLMAIIGGVVIVGGAVAALLLSKKKAKPEDNSFIPDYDTQVLGIEWVGIPMGEFSMGDNFYEGEADEQPVHNVYLFRYYISRYEITFTQYDRFCEATNRVKPDDSGWGRGNRPVINIDWGEARAFCDWLAGKTGCAIRLPTEAQWEKAARHPEYYRYPWGDSPPDCTRANYNCDRQTHPVGSHPQGVSGLGVHDMAGNVAEWCRDEYDPDYYSRSPFYDPINASRDPEGLVSYVIRGGSWDAAGNLTPRSTDRGRGSFYWKTNAGIPTKSSAIGFRIVKED